MLLLFVKSVEKLKMKPPLSRIVDNVNKNFTAVENAKPLTGVLIS